jgi:hypothetical protein
MASKSQFGINTYLWRLVLSQWFPQHRRERFLRKLLADIRRARRDPAWALAGPIDFIAVVFRSGWMDFLADLLDGSTRRRDDILNLRNQPASVVGAYFRQNIPSMPQLPHQQVSVNRATYAPDHPAGAGEPSQRREGTL